jgi:hypothetical protein
MNHAAPYKTISDQKVADILPKYRKDSDIPAAQHFLFSIYKEEKTKEGKEELQLRDNEGNPMWIGWKQIK